jgi:lipopolysaccharide export system permease protein
MTLIDRYILNRLLWNFLILFMLLYLFAVSIDVILNLDEYMRAGREQAGEGASSLMRVGLLVRLMVNFQGPRLFQFFAFMNGMVIVGAMGFTLANMHKNRELLALLASGVSLHRLAVPFLAGTFFVSVLQLLNQEFVMYRVAPMLLRSTSDIGRRSVKQFPVKFIRGKGGELLHAAAFDPVTESVVHLAVLERDERGRTTRRISAQSATWNELRGGWELKGGEALSLPGRDEADGTPDIVSQREPIDFYETEIDPKLITFRRYGQFASMLSLRQISDMLASPQVTDVRALLRHRYARFAALFVSMLVMCISLPSFLLREPASILKQSLICSAMSLPFMMGAAIGMTVDLPGLSPAVSVFLPVILLIPVAMGRWTFLKT